jgi:hypothetical protein
MPSGGSGGMLISRENRRNLETYFLHYETRRRSPGTELEDQFKASM